MAFTVTATQGGSTTAGISMSLLVFTAASASQPGTTAQHQSAVANISVTPAQSGSYICGSLLGVSGTYTAEAGTTFVQNSAHVGLQYAQFRDTATGTGGTPELLGSTNAANGISICAAEIKAAATLAIDGSSPGAVAWVSATSLATASFSPPPGALLVLMVCSNGGGSVTTMSVSDTSGLALAWTQQVKSNVAGDGYSGVWTAQIPAAALPVAPQPMPPGFVSPAASFFAYRFPYPVPTLMSGSFRGAAAASSAGFRCVAVPPPAITHSGELPAPVVMPLSYASPSPQVPFAGYAAASGKAAAATGRGDPFTGRGAFSGRFAGTKSAPGAVTGPAAGSGLAAGVNIGPGSIAGPVAGSGAAAGFKIATGAFTGRAAVSGAATGSPPASGSFTAAAAVSGRFSGSPPAPVFQTGTPRFRWAAGVPVV